MTLESESTTPGRARKVEAALLYLDLSNRLTSHVERFASVPGHDALKIDLAKAADLLKVLGTKLLEHASSLR